MRSRIWLGGLVMLVLLAMAGLGLFALHRTDAAARASTARLAQLQAALDTGRQAETAFKRQVQEWKNILLRSSDAAARSRLEAAFAAEQQRTAALLQALAASAPLLPTPEILPALVTEHAALAQRYAAALAAGDPTTPEGPRAIDALVRGADRQLEQRLDAAADQLATAFGQAAATLSAEAAARYAETRQLLLWGCGLGLLLALALLVSLCRPQR